MGRPTLSNRERYGGVEEALIVGRTLLTASVIIVLSDDDSVEIAMSLPMTCTPLLASPRMSARVSSCGEMKMAWMSAVLAAGSLVWVMTGSGQL